MFKINMTGNNLHKDTRRNLIMVKTFGKYLVIYSSKKIHNRP